MFPVLHPDHDRSAFAVRLFARSWGGAQTLRTGSALDFTCAWPSRKRKSTAPSSSTAKRRSRISRRSAPSTCPPSPRTTSILSDEDIAILAEKHVNLPHCPKTYLKLAMGIAHVPDSLARGVNVALGTDGPASNNTIDILESARLAALVQKEARRDPEALPSMQVLKLATQNGARARGFGDSGILKAGARADVILLGFLKPHLIPRHDPAANVVHIARASNVHYVIADGRVLLHKGELTTLDEDKIMRELEKRAFRLVGQDMKMVREYRG